MSLDILPNFVFLDTFHQGHADKSTLPGNL